MTSLPASIIDTTGGTMTSLPGVDHRHGHGRGGGPGACQVKRE
jgi:hypothetical protein